MKFFFTTRKKNGTGPPAPIQPVTREFDQNLVFRNSATNSYGEPHDADKGPEFNGRPEPRIQSPLQNEDGQTTKLLQTTGNSYFTYNRVPWKLNIRKEVSVVDLEKRPSRLEIICACDRSALSRWMQHVRRPNTNLNDLHYFFFFFF